MSHEPRQAAPMKRAAQYKPPQEAVTGGQITISATLFAKLVDTTAILPPKLIARSAVDEYQVVSRQLTSDEFVELMALGVVE